MFILKQNESQIFSQEISQEFDTFLFTDKWRAGFRRLQSSVSNGSRDYLTMDEIHMEILEELIRSNSLIDEMRQEVAVLKVGGVIDDKANEEVRQTIESLQQVNAELNEEVSFYKGVMAPNFAKKGLRIEKLDMAADSERSVKYSLLLTQVVDTHHWLQGEVEISVRGQYGIEEKSLVLSELDKEKADVVRFRFRYFQNINGKMTFPKGFEPREVMIVAQSSGGKQRLEKGFDWPLSGG